MMFKDRQAEFGPVKSGVPIITLVLLFGTIRAIPRAGE